MTEKIKVLVVGAKRNGYRRAGLQFGEASAPIPLSALTKHQVKELQSDRMLATETAEAVVLLNAEYEELQRKAAIAEELVALLPTDFTWTRTPVEFVVNLDKQLREQAEHAKDLQQCCDSQRTQIGELETKLAAKPDAAKAGHATGRR